MPLVSEQPTLDVPDEPHLYFDPADGRLITFFVRPTRQADLTHNPQAIGNLHHLAFTVSRATYTQIASRLQERGISNTGPIDRGFMDSIYFRDPNGQLLEMACFKLTAPPAHSRLPDPPLARSFRVSGVATAGPADRRFVAPTFFRDRRAPPLGLAGVAYSPASRRSLCARASTSTRLCVEAGDYAIADK